MNLPIKEDTSGELFLKLFELNPAALAISRLADSKVINVNEACLRLFEFNDKSEIVGKTGEDLNILLNPEDRQQVHDSIKKGTPVVNAEGKIRTRGNLIKWIAVSIIQITIDNHVCLMSVIIDITARKQAEEELKIINATLEKKIAERTKEALVKEHEYAELVNQASDGIIITDETGKYIDVNPAVCKMLGYQREELLNLEPKDLVTDEELARSPSKFEELQATNKTMLYLRYLKRKDGSDIPVEVNARRMDNGKIFAIIRDITLRKQEEDQMRKMNDLLENKVAERTRELESSNKELEAFSYSVSHDLRAPLRSILGYTQLIEEDFSEFINDALKNKLNIVKRNAAKMGKLIDDLLEFSRLGKAEVTKSTLNMESKVAGVIAELSETFNNTKDISVNPLATAAGDPAMIRIVWLNLISNALKYSSKKSDPKIEIGCTRAPNETIYYVKDNGAGFRMDYVHKLFGVFQRLHRESDFEGTGVGLALIKRIIAKHGGRVWAEGKENEGATFFFSLPLS